MSHIAHWPGEPADSALFRQPQTPALDLGFGDFKEHCQFINAVRLFQALQQQVIDKGCQGNCRGFDLLPC